MMTSRRNNKREKSKLLLIEKYSNSSDKYANAEKRNIKEHKVK